MNPICKQCGGECCKHVLIPITAMGDDAAWLMARGNLDVCGFWRVPTRCRHLSKGGKCEVYAVRPPSCRSFEVDGAGCRAARRVG